MTSFLRFFLLALTPLLGVTVSSGPAFFYGLVTTLVLAGVATLAFLTRDNLKETGLLWSSLGLATVLVTLVDLVTSLWVPGVRAAWGIYLNLLAFSPVVILLPLEKPRSADLGSELGLALKTGLLLTFLFVVTAVVRESLGRGTLTLVPGAAAVDIPGLRTYPLAILATGAGGFFLAALGVVTYRSIRPRLAGMTRFLTPSNEESTEQAPPAVTAAQPGHPQVAEAPKAAAKAVPRAPAGPASATEPAGDWGETLTSAAADLPSTPAFEKRRLLVIGSGNGELAYYLAMLCLDQAKADRAFSFQIRGVDHFSTRVETSVKGVYREHQIEFIPPAVRDSWMARGQGEERHLWKVGTEPRAHVQFEVADFQQGQIFFAQPSHLTVLNQGIEYVTDDKKVLILKKVCDNLAPGGALVVTGPLKRELMPEGMKRTGTTVFRKA